MYIKRVIGNKDFHYELRQSYRDEDGSFKHRELFNLGKDPSRYIEYPSANSFYFSSELEDALSSRDVEYTTEKLEEAFFLFFTPPVRRILEHYRGNGAAGQWKKLSPQELFRRQQGLHSFDKRRLHFLRCGRIDVGELEGRSWKFLNVLMDKSRDEIEQTIERMESRLRPHEIRSYVYTALHLQKRFPHHPMRHHPVALDSEVVDGYFLEEICRLNRDEGFFAGIDDHDRKRLHPFLAKYVILYFDSIFAGSNGNGWWSAHGAQFGQWHTFHRQVRSVPSMPEREALERLDLTREQFKGMSRKDLIRWYRRRAKLKHPDKGGDHETFIRISEAYAWLLTKKTT